MYTIHTVTVNNLRVDIYSHCKFFVRKSAKYLFKRRYITHILYLIRNLPVSYNVVTLTHLAVTEGELQFHRLLLVEYLLTTVVKDRNAARFIAVNECFKLTETEHYCPPERQQVLVKASYCVLFVVESSVCDFYTALKAECRYFSFYATVCLRVTRDPNWFLLFCIAQPSSSQANFFFFYFAVTNWWSWRFMFI